MDATRRAAVRLALAGKATIEQKKIALDPVAWDNAGRRGIIRVRAVQLADSDLARDGARPRA